MNFLLAGRRTMCTLPSKYQELVHSFETILGAEYVKFNESFTRQYNNDESHFAARNPDIVLLPRNVQQVSEIMKICNKNKFPVVPFGTGTGVEGGSGGICIDLKQMNEISDLSVSDFDCRIEPGVTRKRLNEFLRNTGLWFTVDPGSDASICGMIATSASGTTSVRYGTMKANVRNLEVVLADGTIIYTRGKDRHPWKSSAGYNLTDLFIGSEGTLGLITSAIVNLHPRPAVVSVAVCAFCTVREAIDTVVNLRQNSIPLARIEFLDDQQVKAANAYSHLEMDELSTLFLELHGNTQISIDEQLETVREICEANSCKNFRSSSDPIGIEKLWTARHNSYYATLALRKNSRAFTTDICVPISALTKVICACRNEINNSGLLGTIVGHVGEGNFHCILPYYPDNEAEEKTVQELSHRIVQQALDNGGTCTGEHGIGIGKIGYLEDEFGKPTVELMKTLKRTLDPNNILNPGKIFKEV